jgi:hypothetical protein
MFLTPSRPAFLPSTGESQAFLECEGRKSHAEKRPGTVALAKRLHRASPKTGKRMTLRKISAALADAGHLNERGRLFNQRSIKVMVEG